MKTPSDEELMLRVRDGDPDAFEQIVLRHQAEAWRVAYRFTGDAAEAEDLAQEAFVRIFEASSRYKPTASFRTYLYCVLNRLCLDHVRKMQPMPTAELPPLTDPTRSPDEASRRKERDALVREAVSALPPTQRMAIVLRYFEGLGWAEIAEAMEVTPKAVERLLARGRRTLEDRLSTFLEE
jgi:RNA polymerase sigma-70 factor (ECF subfamily)